MINALKTAIWKKYNGSALLKGALKNGLHYADAPDGTLFPYSVFHFLTGIMENTMGEEHENIVIQFNLYSNDKSETATMFDALDDLYDKCSLAIEGFTHISCLREFVYAPDTQIERVWQIVAQYRIIMEKN